MGRLLPNVSSQSHCYRFVSEWLIPSRADRVASVFLDPESPLVWWPAAFLRGDVLDAGRPDKVGTTLRFLTKGFLPYTFQFVLRVTEARPSEGFVAEVAGDFNGVMKCSVIELSEGETLVRCEWTVLVEQPLVRSLSFLLRPLFAWNHRWVMRRGEKGLATMVDRGRSGDFPRPTFPHDNASVVERIRWKPWTASWDLAKQRERR